MSGDPHAERGISVTLKQDGTNNNPGAWTVFHGTVEGVREQLFAYFGWPADGELAEVAMSELVHEANRQYKAVGNVSAILGGTPTSSKSSDAWTAARGGESKPAEPEKSPEEQMLEKIAGCASVDDLRELWGKHGATLKANEELKAAWVARGAEVKPAA